MVIIFGGFHCLDTKTSCTRLIFLNLNGLYLSFFNLLLFMVFYSCLYFICIHRLVSLLMHKLYLFFFQHVLYISLNTSILKSKNDVSTKLCTKFFCKLLGNFLAQFLHDLEVRALSDSRRYF